MKGFITKKTKKGIYLKANVITWQAKLSADMFVLLRLEGYNKRQRLRIIKQTSLTPSVSRNLNEIVVKPNCQQFHNIFYTFFLRTSKFRVEAGFFNFSRIFSLINFVLTLFVNFIGEEIDAKL